jgi:hypothetical protein
MTNIEMGKACSTHTVIVIYTNLVGNCPKKGLLKMHGQMGQ